MVILLFGPPGCGKGTQAAFLSRLLGVPSISTGEMFRAECKAGTPLGKTVCQMLARGELVGDELVNEVVRRRLSRTDCRNGFVLDGYPRTVPQAEFLDRLRIELGFEPPAALLIDVPEAELVTRITSRRQCPVCGRIYNVLFQPPCREGFCDAEGAGLLQRPDDTEQVVRDRLQAYHDQTAPLLDYYAAGDLHRVAGDRSPEEIHRLIEQVVEKALLATAVW